MKRLSSSIILCLLFLSLKTQNASGTKTRILFIFDASNSMKSNYGDAPRIQFAKKVLIDFVDSVSKIKNVELALRMYGHTIAYPPGDCKDSKLIVPFSFGNVAAIKTAIQAIKPTGITPIEYSLGQAIKDFPDNKHINTIILITDGIEECGGNPCNVKQALVDAGIELKPFIIGIGLKKEQQATFDCVGNYYDAEDQKTVQLVSKIVSTQKLNRTTMQINLLDKSNAPIETNVNMTFYDSKSDAMVYDLYHTMNKKNNPDTLMVDYSKNYKVKVNTIPPVYLDKVNVEKATHNVFGTEAAQGILEIKRENNFFNFNEKVKCIIRKAGSDSILNVQAVNSKEKYLQQKYDIEILTLPRLYWKDFYINKSSANVLEIPSAGILEIKYSEEGDACVMQEKNGKMVWVCSLNPKSKIEQVNLQPGKYCVIFRSSKIKRAIYTMQKMVEVKSNTLISLKF
jgi:Ca-activated chloride channel homolog